MRGDDKMNLLKAFEELRSLNYKDYYEQAGIAAQYCLRYLKEDGSFCCAAHKPIKIARLLEAIGFEIWVKDFSDDSVASIMGINANDKHPLVIGVSKYDTYENQRFILAHQLAHYIFDIRDYSIEHILVQDYKGIIGKANEANEANCDVDDVDAEYRANSFARQLLLPEKEVRSIIARQKFEHRAARLSDTLAVDLSVAFRRLEELDLRA